MLAKPAPLVGVGKLGALIHTRWVLCVTWPSGAAKRKNFLLANNTHRIHQWSGVMPSVEELLRQFAEEDEKRTGPVGTADADDDIKADLDASLLARHQARQDSSIKEARVRRFASSIGMQTTSPRVLMNECLRIIHKQQEHAVTQGRVYNEGNLPIIPSTWARLQ